MADDNETPSATLSPAVQQQARAAVGALPMPSAPTDTPDPTDAPRQQTTQASSSPADSGSGNGIAEILKMLFLLFFANEMGLGDLLGGTGGGSDRSGGGGSLFGGLFGGGGGKSHYSQNDFDMDTPNKDCSMNGSPLADKNPQTGLSYLTMGLIKQESGGNIDATSSCGARGLMQLMPATARQVANDHGIPYTDAAICEPETNLKLGQLYLQDMADRYHGNMTAAIGAYNCGPGNMDKAIERAGLPRGDVPVDLEWLARSGLPEETQNYVPRVVANAQTMYKKDHLVMAQAHEVTGAPTPPAPVIASNDQTITRAPG